jgi:hypothetical protein
MLVVPQLVWAALIAILFLLFSSALAILCEGDAVV